jgi:hypothetical protein
MPIVPATCMGVSSLLILVIGELLHRSSGGFLLQRALPEIRSYMLFIGVYVRVFPTRRHYDCPSLTTG